MEDAVKFMSDFHYVGAFELYSALCLWMVQDDSPDESRIYVPSPTLLLDHCMAKFAHLTPDPALHDLQESLNEGPLAFARAAGYDVEDITEFDLWCLQKLAPHLMEMPLIGACRATDDKMGATLFKDVGSFEVGQRLPFVKTNFLNVTDQMRLHTKKCFHMWHHLEVPCTREIYPSIVEVRMCIDAELNGTYRRISDLEFQHVGDICTYSGSDRKIAYDPSTYVWSLGNRTRGEAAYFTIPEGEGFGKPPYGTVDDGRAIQPPITDWKSREGHAKSPLFVFRQEYLSYAPARCVENSIHGDASKNAVKALSNLPLSGSKQLLQQAIMDCRRNGATVGAIKEGIPRGARMSHFENVEGEVFAEDSEVGRQFFIDLQLKYEALNARHEGSHAFLSEQVRHAMMKGQDKFKEKNPQSKMPYLWGQHGQAMQMHKPVERARLNAPVETNEFLYVKADGSGALLQDTRGDEDGLNLYHPDDDPWHYDRSLACFQNDASLRGFVQFLSGEKLSYVEAGVASDGHANMTFMHDGRKMHWEGLTVDRKFHGRGMLKTDGWSYDGQWGAGMRNGFGKYKTKPSAKAGFVSYEGEWLDNKKHGEGVLDFDGERKIQAIWKDDKVFRVIKYECDTAEDDLDFSVQKDIDIAKNDGEFKIFIHLDGEQVGMPVDAEKVAENDEFLMDGVRYKLEGKTYSYQGAIRQGLYEGDPGTLKTSVGTYKGTFRDGLRHGTGTLTIENFVIAGQSFKKTVVTSANWKNDFPVGDAEVTLGCNNTTIRVNVEPDRTFARVGRGLFGFGGGAGAITAEGGRKPGLVAGLCARGGAKNKKPKSGDDEDDMNEDDENKDKEAEEGEEPTPREPVRPAHTGPVKAAEELPQDFFTKLPATPQLGYKGRVELNFSEHVLKKEWPHDVPRGPPSVLDRVRDGGESLNDKYPERPAFRDAPPHLTKPSQAVFHYLSTS
ncbi:unnamed protein product [Amoebophrya sp. A25]|nr:unnamed protein product [Amoebophrya sp. A25]|eukprot:GSA25T00020108001.1